MNPIFSQSGRDVTSPEERVSSLLAQLASVEEALNLLDRVQLPTRIVREALRDRLDDIRRQPTDDDKRWPLEPPLHIAEHVSLGDDRPELSCRLVVGRAYSLTPGQRDVIRERWGMTPAPLIEVVEVALFSESKYVKRVVLRNCEHVDLSRRRHVVTKLTIDSWGQFMSAAKQKDQEREEAREVVERATEDVLADKPAKGKKPAQTPSVAQLADYYNV